MRHTLTTFLPKTLASTFLAAGLMLGGNEAQASTHGGGDNTEQHELEANVTTGIQSGARIHGITGAQLCANATEIKPSISLGRFHFSASMIESTGNEVCKVRELEGEVALGHGFSAGAGYSKHTSAPHGSIDGHDEKQNEHPDFWEVHLTYRHYFSEAVQGFIAAEEIYRQWRLIPGGKVGLSAEKRFGNMTLYIQEAAYGNKKLGVVSDTRAWVIYLLNANWDALGAGVERIGGNMGAYFSASHPFGGVHQ